MSDGAEKTAKVGESQKKAAVMAVALVVVGAVGIGVGRCSKGPTPAAAAGPSVTVQSAIPVAVAAVDAALPPQIFDNVEDPSWKVGVPQRDMDHDIFAKMKDPQLERSSMTDLFPDKPYRVRLVGSASEHRFALVLIDMQRDGKWDEKWDLRPGQVLRHLDHDPASDGRPGDYTMVKGKWQPH